jgi:hypothetical protein
MLDSNPKVDCTKLERTYGKQEDNPENTRFLSSLKQFLLNYEHLEAGEEPDGHIAMVMILVLEAIKCGHKMKLSS